METMCINVDINYFSDLKRVTLVKQQQQSDTASESYIDLLME